MVLARFNLQFLKVQASRPKLQNVSGGSPDAIWRDQESSRVIQNSLRLIQDALTRQRRIFNGQSYDLTGRSAQGTCRTNGSAVCTRCRHSSAINERERSK